MSEMQIHLWTRTSPLKQGENMIKKLKKLFSNSTFFFCVVFFCDYLILFNSNKNNSEIIYVEIRCPSCFVADSFTPWRRMIAILQYIVILFLQTCIDTEKLKFLMKRRQLRQLGFYFSLLNQTVSQSKERSCQRVGAYCHTKMINSLPN